MVDYVDKHPADGHQFAASVFRAVIQIIFAVFVTRKSGMSFMDPKLEFQMLKSDFEML